MSDAQPRQLRQEIASEEPTPAVGHPGSGAPPPPRPVVVDDLPPQCIPRPDGVVVEPPLVWAAGRGAGLSLAAVRAAMASSPVETEPPGGSEHGRLAAVLVPLFEDAGEARVVLTRRASTMRRHGSEVAFPGGLADDGEALWAAALRETHEEVGIAGGDVEMIGRLTAVTTASGGALIYPFVGVLAERPVLRLNVAEVELAFDVALGDLVAGGVHHRERWTVDGVCRTLHFFTLPTDIVWGATAQVLWELLAVVAGPPGEPARAPRCELA